MKIINEFGQCEYSFEKDIYGEYVHIYNLFITPKHRRKNKARELLTITINNIRKIGYFGEIQIVAKPKKMCISVEKLKSFYQNMGLVVYDCYLELN